MLYFWLISHIRYIVDSNKCFGIKFVNEIHQLLIFSFVYDSDNFVAFLHIVGTICFINCSATVEFMDNEITEFFFFLGNDTYPSLDIMIKNKMIQNNSIKISTKDT